MKAVKYFPYVVIVGLLLALVWSVGLGLAQSPAPAEEAEQPQGEVSITANVASKFSYQGVLKEAGSPVTGSRDMIFRLYVDNGCTIQEGDNITQTAVTVENGLFSTELVVPHNNINGQGLWLDVEIGGAKTSCQEIMAVPYALSLRPGAVISDTTSHAAFNSLSGLLLKSAVYGEADGIGLVSYAGVHGSGDNFGVYGHSATGAALYGSGDVKQGRADNGLVKAGVYVNCNDTLLLGPIREFNNVLPAAFSYSLGASPGRCAIDFGFKIDDRFWVASATGNGDFGVSCYVGGANDILECLRYDASSGSGSNGNIMVLVY